MTLMKRDNAGIENAGVKMRVGLFVTCLVDMMRPEIGFSALKLLEAANCEVVVPEQQTCCGQPGFSAGNFAAAQELAKKFVEEFEQFDYVVIPSGSCGGMVKTQNADLFKDDPAWRSRVEKLAERVYEQTDFLYSVVKLDKLPAAELAYSGFFSFFVFCCGLRELGVQAQLWVLLCLLL